MSFGARIRQEREYMGLNQKDVAEKCGLSKSMICRIEMGSRNINLFDALAIMRFLNIDISILNSIKSKRIPWSVMRGKM